MPFWSACRTSKIKSKSLNKRCSRFAQLGAFLGKCALPSTKRDGPTGYSGCARIHGRGRRRTALDGNLSKLPNSREHALQLERRRISPALEHPWCKTWLSISSCPADQRRPHRLQRRVCQLRWTKRTWRALAAAAQTAAAAEAAAASFDLQIIDGKCRRLEARDLRRRDAALHRHSRRLLTRRVLTCSDCFGPKTRKHDTHPLLVHATSPYLTPFLGKAR